MKFLELSRFLRNQLDGRDMSIQQVCMACGEHIPVKRIYDFLEGRRSMQGWEVSLFQQRFGITIPWRYLRGEDKYGVQKKDFEKRQLKLPGLREKGKHKWPSSSKIIQKY